MTPARHDVGEGAVGIFVERRLVRRLTLELNVGEGHEKGQDAVDEHQELRVAKILA